MNVKDELIGLTHDEREAIEEELTKLMDSRRISGAGKQVALTDRELKVMANLAEVLARDRVNKATGARTIRVHLHQGNPVEFEIVHEKHEKRKLS